MEPATTLPPLIVNVQYTVYIAMCALLHVYVHVYTCVWMYALCVDILCAVEGALCVCVDVL